MPTDNAPRPQVVDLQALVDLFAKASSEASGSTHAGVAAVLRALSEVAQRQAARQVDRYDHRSLYEFAAAMHYAADKAKSDPWAGGRRRRVGTADTSRTYRAVSRAMPVLACVLKGVDIPGTPIRQKEKQQGQEVQPRAPMQIPFLVSLCPLCPALRTTPLQSIRPDAPAQLRCARRCAHTP